MRPSKNQPHNSWFVNTQAGSAIIYVFIGVILFGLLMYALSRSNSMSGSLATKGTAKAQAQVVLDYGSQVRNGVEKLIAKGCSESQIAFANPSFGDVNPNAPADKSCDVFNAAGGNVAYKSPSILGSASILFMGRVAIWDVGSGGANPDLTLVITDLPKDVCIAIDKSSSLGLDTDGTPRTSASSIYYVPFTGDYSPLSGSLTVPSNLGKADGCILSANGDSSGSELIVNAKYAYYMVLIPR